MANTSLPNLTERTATANSDLIHVNSGGTDYKETKGNFLSDINSSISALNNSLTKSSGTFSANNGTVSSDKLYKFNDLVVFQFTFVASSNIPSGSSGQGFVTLPSGYRPEVGIGISGQLGTGQSNFFISSNGMVQSGTAISSGQTVRLSGSFISA